jgi:hypothetical protein
MKLGTGLIGGFLIVAAITAVVGIVGIVDLGTLHKVGEKKFRVLS